MVALVVIVLFNLLNIRIMFSNYLPEYHCFTHRAAAPWPRLAQQVDWVDLVLTVESWLNSQVGPHHQQWAWDSPSWQLPTYYMAVAFREQRHQTLFLLRWSTL